MVDIPKADGDTLYRELFDAKKYKYNAEHDYKIRGYDVELTPQTRDGGKDIYAARRDDLGTFLYIVECKRYAPDNPVGVEVIRALHGVADIDRVTAIWRECLQRYGGPYLFGAKATVADAMYAPVCTRFATYDVKLDPASAAYRDLMLKFPPMMEWTAAARSEPEEVEELDVEF